MRFPSFPALERTAVMGFSVPATLNLPATTAVKAALFRQAAYPVWAEQTFTTESYMASWRTDILNAVTTVASNSQAITAAIAPSVTSFSAGNVTASNLQLGVAGATVPATTSVYVPMGVDLGTGPNPFMYVPSNFNLYFVAVATSGSNLQAVNLSLSYEIWASPGEVGTSSTSFSTLTSNTGGISNLITNTTGIWVRPRSMNIQVPAAVTEGAVSWTVYAIVAPGTVTYTPSTTTYGTATVGAGTKVALYPLSYPVEFTNSTLPWYSTRVTAASILGTNVTQIQKKGGTILAGRVAPSVQNPWVVTQSYVNGLHPAEKAFLPLETGIYSYCPPSTDLANFWDYTLPTSVGANTPLSCPVMRLDNDSLVNIMYITASSDIETLAVTIDWHIEFRTSSALFPIGLSAMSLESLHTAQLALASVGFFFENPNHKDILSKVVSAAKRFAPTAVGLVAGPTASKIVKGAIMLASRPRSDMKTTTAQSSGWNGPVNTKHKKKEKSKNKKKAQIGPRRRNGKF